MTRTRTTAAAVFVAAGFGAALAADPPAVAPSPRPATGSRAVAPPPRPVIDLSDYRTARDATPADPKRFKLALVASAGAAGYLGIAVEARNGSPVVAAVEPDSPAAAAGFRPGDVVRAIDGGSYPSPAAARDALRSRLAGEKVAVAVDRDGTRLELIATLTATTRPMTAAAGRGVLGVTLGGRAPEGGVRVRDLTPDGPAARAGVQAGDVVVKVDGATVDGETGFRDLFATKQPGDRLDLLVVRDGKRVEARAVLAAGDARPGGGWDDRVPTAWKKPAYRLAILGVEYPDVKHNPKVTDAAWTEAMFSTGTYTGTSATGEPVYGSMNDYYREQSTGTFRVGGEFLGWVEAKRPRLDYTTGTGTATREKTALLSEALDLYHAAHGKDALKDYDGIFFLYAGERVPTTRGGLYWPHRANLVHAGRRWPYFIVHEGGPRMNDISVFCHEFGHMLGLPDLYARPEQPGSEGAGVWCAMSTQVAGGRPQHLCAWSKEQLGWVRPTLLDPRVRQKLVLSPVEGDPTQCYKVVVRADGSEYFLLENRRKTGFDESLPADGLLIWRVVNNRPILEESHGIEGATGPRVFLDQVPYPSAANTAFTPYTTPSSKSHLGGGLPVYVTNIRKLPDGRVTFHIGYEYQ